MKSGCVSRVLLRKRKERFSPLRFNVSSHSQIQRSYQVFLPSFRIFRIITMITHSSPNNDNLHPTPRLLPLALFL